MAIKTINPATGELLQVFDEWTTEKTSEAVAQAHEAWLEWRNASFGRREEIMKKVAKILREEREEHVRMMALEMGKPVSEGRAEVEKCAWTCEFYAENAPRFLAPEPAESDGSRAYVVFRPLGVILAVMPWNFPFWQVFRCAVPTLMAGNAVVLKHSSNVPACALAIEDVFHRAGLPDNLFRTLLIGSGQVEKVIVHDLVSAVSLTGSDGTGRMVAAAAGRALKKTVLELGGSDPFIVLAGADIDNAAKTGARARCINSGQSCIAAKRFIVEGSVFVSFMSRFIKAMADMSIGDPLDETTQIGPLAREDLLRELHEQVTDAAAKGVEIVLGGAPLERKGFYYPPTILVGVRPSMRAYHEELFGPVASVIKVADADEAVSVANDTPFGLGSSVWTEDVRKGEELAARIEAGSVFINGLVKSDPRLPFGGTKSSGYGRELAHFGIREFVNVQTVWVR